MYLEIRKRSYKKNIYDFIFSVLVLGITPDSLVLSVDYEKYLCYLKNK